MTNKSFIDFLELKPHDKILEVGSGLGILASQVERRVTRGNVIGIEYSADQLANAIRQRRMLHFVQGDAHELPFADREFHVVYCRYLLEHVSNPLRVLQEVKRVLKPGGKFFAQENNILINVFYPECPKFDSVWRKFALLQVKLGGDAVIGKKLFYLLKEAGFSKTQQSMAPEIHNSGMATFKPWIVNLIGNINSAAEALENSGLATRKQINDAVRELTEFKKLPNGSAFFYWNRVRATK